MRHQISVTGSESELAAVTNSLVTLANRGVTVAVASGDAGASQRGSNPMDAGLTAAAMYPPPSDLGLTFGLEDTRSMSTLLYDD